MSPRRGATCTKRETRVKTWGVRAKISWNVTRNQRRTVFSADDHTRTHTFTRGNVPFFLFFFSTMEKGVERSWQARVKYTSATRKSFNPTKKKKWLIQWCAVESSWLPFHGGEKEFAIFCAFPELRGRGSRVGWALWLFFSGVGLCRKM